MIEEQIKLIADALLSDNPTYEEVEKVAESVLAAERVQHPDSTITKQNIVDIIVVDRKIYQPVSSIMQDDDEGANWLPEFRANGGSNFRLWNDYKKHLTLPTPAIQEIDKTTEKVLNINIFKC